MIDKLRDLAAEMLWGVNVQKDQLWFHSSTDKSYSVQFEMNGKNYELTLEAIEPRPKFSFDVH